MKASSGIVRLSASDLSNHLGCHHLTSLDLAVSLGTRPAPAWHSPDAKVLQERGIAHEDAYLKHLEAQGVSVLNLRDIDDSERSLTETREAMKSGAAAIAQATMVHGRWFGRSDVLRRVERPSKLGDWSYEVYDCKVASETKTATILQVSLYSEAQPTTSPHLSCAFCWNQSVLSMFASRKRIQRPSHSFAED